MADTDVPPESGLVVKTVAMFEHAIGLARGVPEIRATGPPTVPREDMVAAHAIAEQVMVLVQQWRGKAQSVRWPVVTATYSIMRIDAAMSGARRLESELRQIVSGTSAAAATARSLAGGWPVVWESEMVVAQELLEIAAGERPMEGSDIALAGEAGAYGLLVSIPVLAEVILVFEAVSGRSVYNWRKLSVTERMYAIMSVILPPIAGVAVGAAARQVGRGVGITKRAVAVGIANSRFASALVNIAGLRITLKLAIGLRVLPERDFLELLRLLRAPSLTAREAKKFTFYLTRIDYLWRSSSWLQIAKQQGKLRPGWHVIDRAVVEPNETAALDALAKLTGKPVVSLPKVMPEVYKARGRMKQMSDAKYPDGLLDTEMFDLWVAETDKIFSVFTKISEKGLQANTAAIYLGGPKTTLTINAVEAELHTIWAKPRYMYIDRVILFTSNDIKEFSRPAAYFAVPGRIGYARTGLPPRDERIKAAEEVDAEPDPDTVPER